MNLSAQLIRVVLMPLCLFGWGLAVADSSDPAPLTEEQAEAIDLDSHVGNVVYLDFWASWCIPCRESLPWLETLYQELKSEGLTVVAVGMDQDAEKAAQFLKRYPVTYPRLEDPEGEIAELFSLQGLPTSYLIDRDGNVRAIHLGFHEKDAEALREEVRSLVHESG